MKYSDLLADIKNIDKYFLGFSGELYFNPEEIISYVPQVINNIKSFVKSKHFQLRLHAPIIEIDYSQIQNTITNIQSLYSKVFQLCKVLDINSVVAHVEFDYQNDFLMGKQFESAYFLWRILCDQFSADNILINIENHCEIEPDYLIMLRERINSPYLGLCVDIGHFNAFGNLTPKKWLEKYPIGSIKEVHLADNEGDGDSHLPLGDGNIDFTSFFGMLSERNERCAFVLEPRNLREAQKSLSFLRKEGFIEQGKCISRDKRI